MRAALILLLATTLFAQKGEDGLTYAERKQQWLRNAPDPRTSMSDDKKRLYFSAWLQKGIYNEAVSQGLHSILGDFWLTGGRSHHGYLIGLVIKYGTKGIGLIDRDDETTVRNKYADDLIRNSGVFEDFNPNKQMWAMVGVYLYAHYFERNIELPVYGHRQNASDRGVELSKQNWPSFSYGGNRYEFGSGPHNAKQLAEDYLSHQMVEWYLQGNREMDSLNYHRAFVGAMILLYAMAEDKDLRTRGRMAGELAILDAIMDYGGSEWGGTLGRADFSRLGSSSIFPFYEYFGKGKETTSRPDLKVLYALDYEPPALLVDLAVLTDERDDYFHFHKEYHNSTLKHNEGRGKWNYVTPYYNLGSNVGGYNSGWQLTIRGSRPGKFIRLWINDRAHTEDKNETRYLGNDGKQFRNALFANIGGGPIVHERLVDETWDRDEKESGWLFKEHANVFVAIGVTNSTASVEVALEGVDYPTYNDFKAAVKSTAALDDVSYTTSRGVVIDGSDDCGLDRPGDCSFPFPRMETETNRGKLIDWSNNVMTLSHHGKTLTYDFKNWRADEPENTKDEPPRRPSNVRVKAQ